MKKKIIILLSVVIILLMGIVVWFNIPPVSYTHLDVYKRQLLQLSSN